MLHVLGTNNQFEALQRVWLHMKENLGTLTPLSIDLVQKYFTEHAGVKEDGSKKWKVSTVHVDPKVSPLSCTCCVSSFMNLLLALRARCLINCYMFHTDRDNTISIEQCISMHNL